MAEWQSTADEQAGAGGWDSTDNHADLPSSSQQVGTSLHNQAKGWLDMLGVLNFENAPKSIQIGDQLIQAQKNEWTQAKEEYHKGNYVGAATRLLGAAVPIIGPMINQSAKKLATPGQRVEGATDIVAPVILGGAFHAAPKLASMAPELADLAESVRAKAPQVQAAYKAFKAPVPATLGNDVLGMIPGVSELHDAIKVGGRTVRAAKAYRAAAPPKPGPPAEGTFFAGGGTADAGARTAGPLESPPEAPGGWQSTTWHLESGTSGASSGTSSIATEPAAASNSPRGELPPSDSGTPGTAGAAELPSGEHTPPLPAPSVLAHDNTAISQPSELPASTQPGTSGSPASGAVPAEGSPAAALPNPSDVPRAVSQKQSNPLEDIAALPEIPRVPVEGSSNIQAIGYHPDSQTMHIEFKGKGDEPGRVYEYTGITPEEHKAFMEAESKGKHFARQIKPRFPTPGELAKSNAKEAADAAQPNLPGTGTESTGEPSVPAATLRTEPSNGTQNQEVDGAAPAGVEVSQPDQAGPGPGEGKITRVPVPGSDTVFPARYRIRELSDIQTSHNGETFQPNPEYSAKNDRDYSNKQNQAKIVNGALPNRFDPAYHITDNPDATNGPIVVDQKGQALGGNGRGMMLQRVYATNPKGAAEYRAMLEDKAPQFGIDPAEVAKFKQPVLVREISDAHLHDPQAAITDFNKKGTADLTPSEQSITDSRRVSQDTLDSIAGRFQAKGFAPTAKLSQVLSGGFGVDVMNRLINDGVITSQERASYVKNAGDGEALTPKGQDRISKLLVGRFFNDPTQMDTAPAAIQNKLQRIAAPLASIEEFPEWSLTPKIREAMDLIEDARVHGNKNLDVFTQQSGMGTKEYTPEIVATAKLLQKMPAGQLANVFSRYAEDARHFSKGPGLFGETAPTPTQALADAFTAVRDKSTQP